MFEIGEKVLIVQNGHLEKELVGEFAIIRRLPSNFNSKYPVYTILTKKRKYEFPIVGECLQKIYSLEEQELEDRILYWRTHFDASK